MTAKHDTSLAEPDGIGPRTDHLHRRGIDSHVAPTDGADDRNRGGSP